MSIFKNIKSGIQQHFDKKKEEKAFIERLQLEAKVQKQQIFQEEFRKSSRLVAIAHAKKEAAQKSGLQKLRAINRSRNLNDPTLGKSSFLANFSEYTQKNLANREKNLKRTEELRAAAKKMREDKLQEQQRLRQERMNQPRLSEGFRSRRI